MTAELMPIDTAPRRDSNAGRNIEPTPDALARANRQIARILRFADAVGRQCGGTGPARLERTTGTPEADILGMAAAWRRAWPQPVARPTYDPPQRAVVTLALVAPPARVDQYQALEARLEEVRGSWPESAVDKLLDRMDAIWRQLSPAEIDHINQAALGHT